MPAIALTGFLGTGKTTLTLALATTLSEQGARVAIIENERGGIGVDGAYLAAHGLTVREIRAGCVCCELTQPLRTTIRLLRESFNPDWLLLEASGVANADALRRNLEHPPVDGIAWTFLALIDATRFRKLWAEQYGLGMLIRPQVAQADLLVLSKVDTVSAVQAKQTLNELQRQRPEIVCLPYAESDQQTLRTIVEQLKRLTTA
jgi:G3E family GTPase